MTQYRLLPGQCVRTLLLLALALHLTIPAFAATRASGSTFVPGQVVVKLQPAAGATIEQINAAYATTTLDALAPQLGIYLLAVPPGASVEQLVGQMAADARLLYAEPNFLGESPEGNPRNISAWGGFDAQPYTQQTAFSTLGIPQAQQISRGAGVTVAVLDTGLQLDHPALAGHIVPGYDFVDGDTTPSDAGNGVDDDADGVVDEMLGHGTHVAGIIHLVAPDAAIMPVRVLDSDGHGDFFLLSEAIAYAVEHGAQVINLSLGTAQRSALVDDAIRAATEKGVVVVAAAGNLNTRDEQYPAATQCALPVTSVGANDVKSSFSNYGGWIDFAAPGEAIYSLFPGSGYATWSGTSMATPFVAGQAALIKALAPAADTRTVATLLAQTAVSLDAANPSFRDQLGGRIDIGASLAELQQHGLPAPESGVISGSCVEGEGGGSYGVYLPLIRR